MGSMMKIAVLLLDTFFGALAVVLLTRLLLQLAKADFYNPISQFIVRVTNPLVMPPRRLIPGLWGLDMATVLVLLLVQMLATITLGLVYGHGFINPLPVFIWALLGTLGLLLSLYFALILVMIILSWVAPGSRHPGIFLVYQLTEPVMSRFRKLLPAMGGIDFSPILAFLVLRILQILLGDVAAAVGLPSHLVIGL